MEKAKRALANTINETSEPKVLFEASVIKRPIAAEDRVNRLLSCSQRAC